jgi:hypothetical protein
MTSLFAQSLEHRDQGAIRRLTTLQLVGIKDNHWLPPSIRASFSLLSEMSIADVWLFMHVDCLYQVR